jgi:hypothetical protein
MVQDRWRGSEIRHWSYDSTHLTRDLTLFQSRLVRRNSTLAANNFSMSVLLDKIDILMSDTKLFLEVDSWLCRKSHSRSEQSTMVSFVEVRRLVR